MVRRLCLGALVAASLLGVLPGAAEALAPRLRAGTTGEAVEVVFTRQSDGTGSASDSVAGCDWRAVPYTAVSEFGHVPAEAIAERQSEDEELYVVWCGTSEVQLYWLGPGNFVDPTGPLLEEVLRRVEVRPAGVNVRPDSRGITGIESYFWVEGPGTETFSESVSAFGITVAVSVTLAGVEWDFGDGSPVVGAGLGEAWPERSSVAHAYRHASGETPYTVTARLIFQPSYTVDGVPGAPLDPIVVPVQRPYTVNQLQAVRRS